MSPSAEALPILTAEQTQRYSRHLLLPEFGSRGQAALLASRVLVIGAGGLGAPILLYLAAAGVGWIGIVEFDQVESSNLQRQILYRQNDVGQTKLQAAARTLQERYPEVKLELHAQRLEAGNALALISQYDLVLDGSDNFATRYLVNDACVLAQKPYVWGSIFRFEGQVSLFWEQAPQEQGRNYRDLYPQAPPPEHAPSCSEGGVLGVLCGVIGSLMATEAIKFLSGCGDTLLGHLLTFDALQMRFRKLPLARAPERQAITSLPPADAAQACTLQAAATTHGLSPAALQAMRATRADVCVIDLRSTDERSIVALDFSIAMEAGEVLAALETGQLHNAPSLVLHCKSGLRSGRLLNQLHAKGYTRVQHLQGGILAWITELAPELPRY